MGLRFWHIAAQPGPLAVSLIAMLISCNGSQVVILGILRLFPPHPRWMNGKAQQFRLIGIAQ
jgi:hypothetical protein